MALDLYYAQATEGFHSWATGETSGTDVHFSKPTLLLEPGVWGEGGVCYGSPGWVLLGLPHGRIECGGL